MTCKITDQIGEREREDIVWLELRDAKFELGILLLTGDDALTTEATCMPLGVWYP